MKLGYSVVIHSEVSIYPEDVEDPASPIADHRSHADGTKGYEINFWRKKARDGCAKRVSPDNLEP